LHASIRLQHLTHKLKPPRRNPAEEEKINEDDDSLLKKNISFAK
jgi:hypothetical protein